MYGKFYIAGSIDFVKINIHKTVRHDFVTIPIVGFLKNFRAMPLFVLIF